MWMDLPRRPGYPFPLEADENGILQPAGELEEPLIVGPTSETIIGELFARWVQSYRICPANQPMGQCGALGDAPPTFLEPLSFFGRRAHRSCHCRGGTEETKQMLHVYADFAENWLAMPVLRGEKTEAERFPGAESTVSRQ